MDISATGVQNLLKKRGVLFASRPAIYILIVVFAVVTAYAYKLRAVGIFSCQADGYTFDRYLAYCNGTDFGDYEHGALWFDLEPSAKKFASGADVIFLGDSHIQFGFSTDATNQWFSSASSRYYLLGFIFGENVVFEEEILRKLKPKAKVYVIAVNFLERSETLPAKDVMHDPASRYRYEAKYRWQLAHRQICEKLPAICGHRYAIFRSRETGAYHKSGKVGVEGSPVYYEHDMNQEKIKYYSASGRSFLSQLPVRRDCIILTTVPTVRANAFAYSPSVETAEAVAKELGVSFVPAALDGLRTFDGSHLDQSSAERWSKAFFQVAGPQILTCIKDLSKSRL
jgi:hypothetical protein